MSSRRGDQLKTAASVFCGIHDEWVEDKNRPAPDEVYWDAVDTLLETYGSGDIPEESRALYEAVEEFRDARDEFDERDQPLRNLYPPEEFWAAREKVAAALAGQVIKAELPPLESIASLMALPGMGVQQVAKIYGFKDRHGNLLTGLVQQELDKPGSVLKTPGSIDGRDWADPRAKVTSEVVTAERHPVALAEKKKRNAKSSKPCPETPRELWEMTKSKTPLSIQQASRMLCRPESEVAQMFAEFDAGLETGLGESHVDPKTARIRELAAEGKSLCAIAKELDIEPKQVADALKGWKAPEPVKA